MFFLNRLLTKLKTVAVSKKTGRRGDEDVSATDSLKGSAFLAVSRVQDGICQAKRYFCSWKVL